MISILKNFFILMCIMMSPILLTSCDQDEDIKYTIKIIATGGDFTGWYTIDGGDYKEITTADTTDGTSYYTYSKDINDNINYISIHVDGETSSTTYVLIEIYEDDELVASASDSYDSSEDAVVAVNLTYDPDDEDE